MHLDGVETGLAGQIDGTAEGAGGLLDLAFAHAAHKGR